KVDKNYGKVKALQNVDLKVYKAEVIALLGPNGAGKTTAINLLLGLLRPNNGQVRVFGQDPKNANNRMRTGVMLQIPGIPETLRVREHIDLFSSYYPKPMSMQEVLAATGLADLENRMYGKLSGGQKQRLHLALALCGDPDLVFLDEPTTGLDVASRRALWEQVRKITNSGKTVVLTTHYIEEAESLADRVVVIKQGEIIAEGSPSEIKAITAATKIRLVTKIAHEDIKAMNAVSSVKYDGAATLILASKAEEIVLELLQKDNTIHGLEVTTAGLEDAFLALTQKKVA
ncbi:MAG TPA: ABC transporter ATP-binding protein, partial [Trueperaceae bacterium]|nr:ABC transporter ATP-binding protein [Trueperaceae bacterium]